MSVLDELVAHLQAAGVGTWSVDLFAGEDIPDKPTALVFLEETPGLPSEYVFGKAAVDSETPGIRVIARAADYAAARIKAEAAMDSLSQIQAQVLTGVFYHHVTPQQPPFRLGLDDNQRPSVVFNVLAQKDPS